MVGQADADVGELPAVPGKDPQQTPLQGKTAGGNAHGARLQALTGEQLRLAGGDALKGGGNVRVELFPLWRQENRGQRSSDSSRLIMRVTLGWSL